MPFARTTARLARLAILLAFAAAPAAVASHLDELILFDRTGSAPRRFDEGLVRQRLGLLDADGQPALPLVDLVSADGKRAAYDMTGRGMNPTFDNRLIELRNDGGVLTLITHGNRGILDMERVTVKGFGTGTGSSDRCAQAALPVTTVRTNVTVNLAVCKGNDSGINVTSVATSLRDAIVAAGGSVRTMVATADTVFVAVRVAVRTRMPVPRFEDDELRAVARAHAAHVAAMQRGLPFEDHYRTFQNALDAAAPPDRMGRRMFATLRYSAEIGTTTIEKAAPRDPATALFEELDTVIRDTECADSCGPVGAAAATWSAVKTRYR